MNPNLQMADAVATIDSLQGIVNQRRSGYLLSTIVIRLSLAQVNVNIYVIGIANREVQGIDTILTINGFKWFIISTCDAVIMITPQYRVTLAYGNGILEVIYILHDYRQVVRTITLIYRAVIINIFSGTRNGLTMPKYRLVTTQICRIAEYIAASCIDDNTPRRITTRRRYMCIKNLGRCRVFLSLEGEGLVGAQHHLMHKIIRRCRVQHQSIDTIATGGRTQ